MSSGIYHFQSIQTCSACPGNYTVIATFAGSQSYYASYCRIRLHSQLCSNSSTNRYTSIKPSNHSRPNDVHGRCSNRYNHCNSHSHSANAQETPIKTEQQKSISPFLVLKSIEERLGAEKALDSNRNQSSCCRMEIFLSFISKN